MLAMGFAVTMFLICCITVRAVDPFGQVFRPTGVELPGWDFAFLPLVYLVLSNA